MHCFVKISKPSLHQPSKLPASSLEAFPGIQASVWRRPNVEPNRKIAVYFCGIFEASRLCCRRPNTSRPRASEKEDVAGMQPAYRVDCRQFIVRVKNAAWSATNGLVPRGRPTLFDINFVGSKKNTTS